MQQSHKLHFTIYWIAFKYFCS